MSAHKRKYIFLKNKDIKLPSGILAFLYFNRDGLDFIKVFRAKGKTKEYLLPLSQEEEDVFIKQLELNKAT